MRNSILLALAGVLAAVSPAQAQLIINGGFELPVITPNPFIQIPNGSAAMTGWVADGTNGIALVGTFWQPAEGAQSVELNFNTAGGITQSVVTNPGQAYQLDFAMSGQPNQGPAIKEMQIFWDGNLVSTQFFDTTGFSLGNMGWQQRSVLLPAATGALTDLRFFGSVPLASDGGAALDDVRLTLAAVPEPATLAVVGGLAIGGVVVSIRRRKSKRVVKK